MARDSNRSVLCSCYGGVITGIFKVRKMGKEIKRKIGGEKTLELFINLNCTVTEWEFPHVLSYFSLYWYLQTYP